MIGFLRMAAEIQKLKGAGFTRTTKTATRPA